MAQWIKTLAAKPDDLFYSHLLEGGNLQGVYPLCQTYTQERKGEMEERKEGETERRKEGRKSDKIKIFKKAICTCMLCCGCPMVIVKRKSHRRKFWYPFSHFLLTPLWNKSDIDPL